MGFGERNCLSQKIKRNQMSKALRVFLSPMLLVLFAQKVHNFSKKLTYMDLKTFVRESLIQIDEALSETSGKFTQYKYKY